MPMDFTNSVAVNLSELSLSNFQKASLDFAWFGIVSTSYLHSVSYSSPNNEPNISDPPIVQVETLNCLQIDHWRAGRSAIEVVSSLTVAGLEIYLRVQLYPM